MNATQTSWRPERAVEIIAGTPPGGGLDRTARALAEALATEKLVDVPVNVVNMPGDGSRKIWAYLDRFPGDPHVLVVSSPNVTTDHLTGQAAFDHASYTPLAVLHNEYIVFVARADSPITDGREFMRRLKSDARSLNIAVATSVGNPNHIALARVTRHAGGDVKAVKVTPYDSARHAVAAVIAGECDAGAISAASAVPELIDGTLHAFGVSAPERLAPPFASTPTWREHGVDCVIGAWRGIDGAKGIDARHIAFWDEAFARATSSQVWHAAIKQHHWSVLYRNSAELAAYLPRERAEMRATLADLGLLPDRG